MLPLRLRERIPSAQAFGAASIAGYNLRFHKRGRDGSGKCDASKAATDSARILGVLYSIDENDVPVLDQIEGLGIGYRRERATVLTKHGIRREAFFYVATATDPNLKPWRWYKDLVVTGAIDQGLDARWIRWLMRVPSRPDPDFRREIKATRLLSASIGARKCKGH